MRVHFLAALAVAVVATSSGVSGQNAALPKQTSAASTTSKDALPHWVGPLKGNPITTACYRQTHIAQKKKCATGFVFDNMASCWAECPLEYPVQCGAECLPQNQDCAKEIVTKVQSVANAALSTATAGVFGALTKAAKGVQQGVKCGQQLYSVLDKIMAYIKEVETKGGVDTTKNQLISLLKKSDFVVSDLPIAVATCLGLPVPDMSKPAAAIQGWVNQILDKVVDKDTTTNDNVLSTDNFLNLTNTVVRDGTLSSLKPEEKEKIKSLITGGSTCGMKLKKVIDKGVKAVKDEMAKNPNGGVDLFRFAIYNSDLFMTDIPDATTDCMKKNAPDGFKTRDELIKTVHVIIDRVIDAASQNGKPVSKSEYAIVIANFGLDAIAVYDPTGLAAMFKEFVQPICGPTSFIGEIDDGSAADALGLTTSHKAFYGTTGQWSKKGDGKLTLNFKSVDTLDVLVNVLSGGKLLYQVPVKKGEKVTWSKPLSEFQGKTLYLDRWRAGFLGIPGSGGGSVLSWVPMSTTGSMQLSVPINPTTFSDNKAPVASTGSKTPATTSKAPASQKTL